MQRVKVRLSAFPPAAATFKFAAGTFECPVNLKTDSLTSDTEDPDHTGPTTVTTTATSGTAAH